MPFGKSNYSYERACKALETLKTRAINEKLLDEMLKRVYPLVDFRDVFKEDQDYDNTVRMYFYSYMSVPFVTPDTAIRDRIVSYLRKTFGLEMLPVEVDLKRVFEFERYKKYRTKAMLERGF